MSNSAHSTNTLFMSVLLEHWPANVSSNATQPKKNIHSAVWLQSGVITRNSKPMTPGSGSYLEATDHLENASNSPAVIIRVSLHTTETEITAEELNGIKKVHVSSHSFITSLTEAVLRFDQVNFPAAAIAYKHTHPGAGVRYLVDGGLQLDSDHGSQQYRAGEAWFEAENSPVMATAINTMPSCFIRLMLLPIEFEGHPTLTLVNADDANKPRLQTNTRHFDKRIVV